MPELSILFQRFGLALGLGLMIGIEREREKGSASFAGIRTFPLISITGCAAAMIEDLFLHWVFVAVFIVLGIFIVHSRSIVSSASPVQGITTEVAAMLAFLLGGMAWWQIGNLAAALAVVAVFLLAAKRPLEQLAQKMGHEDIIAFVQFGVITLIILPIVPNHTFGPLNVLNPYKIWLMVVLISAVNLVGYALSKLVEARKGIELAGMIGGLISSTAVALGFSRQSRNQTAFAGAFAVAITLASVIMLPRILFITFSVNPALAQSLAQPVTTVALSGILGCFILWRFQKNKAPAVSESETASIKHRNPLELWYAVSFGLFFGLVLFVSKAAQVKYASEGIYFASLFGGLADVDAVALSLANLAPETISLNVATQGILLAIIANTVVKGLIVFSAGAAAMRMKVAPVFLLMIVTTIAAFKLLT